MIFGPTREEVTGDGKQLFYEGLHSLYLLQNIILLR